MVTATRKRGRPRAVREEPQPHFDEQLIANRELEAALETYVEHVEAAALANAAKRNIKAKLSANRRRSMIERGVVGTHTEKQWLQLKERHGYKCAKCGTPETSLDVRLDELHFAKLTKDHVLPISRGGGDNIENIQPLCRSCNSRKHAKFDEPIVCVSGGMDCLHVGHLDLFDSAARYGRLVVILNSDEFLIRKKGYRFMPWQDRARVILALNIVTAVTPVDDADGTVSEALRRVRPDYFCNGGDRTEPNEAEDAICRELDIHQLFNVGGGKTRSSSEIIGRLR